MDEESRRTSAASFSVQTLTNVKTYVLLQSFFVSYDVLLSLAKYILYIYYGLYFDDVDGVDVFSTGHSQYFGSSFFFGGGLDGSGEANDFMSSHTASKVSMCMRSRSSSRSKFHSHVRFSRPLTYTIDHPVLPSQSMVISPQQGSARPVGSCQKFPWHGTRKNVMRENGPLFQHRHFLHDKFLVNDEFLQIHKRWHEHVVEKTAIDCSIS
ncbi:hypothetical protein ALC57_03971 [Trachymyrmex cornetzi]|uniref:Uncharacterized protein n=1 Tax=Trachymyrmex cornetzi TaxID=471704 RepID=A0A151JLX8_9HYME|nr:hypothetical protein ALC57_03971 [Trachymyrmex cornetzi]